MRVEFDRRGRTVRRPETTSSGVQRRETGSSGGTEPGGPSPSGIEDFASPRVGLTVPEAKEEADRDAAWVYPPGAFSTRETERYDSWVGSTR